MTMKQDIAQIERHTRLIREVRLELEREMARLDALDQMKRKIAEYDEECSIDA